jgi:hypothetical protein
MIMIELQRPKRTLSINATYGREYRDFLVTGATHE